MAIHQKREHVNKNIFSLRVWNSVNAILVLFVIYTASFGPACWIMSRLDAGRNPDLFRVFSRFYQPVSVAIIRSPDEVSDCMISFLELGIARDAIMYYDAGHGIYWVKPGYTYTVLSL